MVARGLEECNIAPGVDSVTSESFVTLRPNPEYEHIVYAMTPAMAVDIANALLAAAKRNSH